MSTFNGIIAWKDIEGAKEMVETILLRDADVSDAECEPAYDAYAGMSDSVLSFSCEGEEDAFGLTVLQPLMPYVKAARVEMRNDDPGMDQADFIWDGKQWVRRDLYLVCDADDLLETEEEQRFLKNLLRADGSDMARRVFRDLFKVHTSVVDFVDEDEDADEDEDEDEA